MISATLFSPVFCSNMLCLIFLAIAGRGDAVDNSWSVMADFWDVASSFWEVASSFWEVGSNFLDSSKSNVWNVGTNMDVVSIGLSRDICMPKDEDIKINTRFIVIIIFS